MKKKSLVYSDVIKIEISYKEIKKTHETKMHCN